jgi:predicted GNAT family N-acyltransferase
MQTPHPFRIRKARTPEDVQQALAIRETVFVAEQGIPAMLEQDGWDDASIHVLAFYKEAAVATGRLTATTDRGGVLARIAVLPTYRGQGLGKRVVQHLEDLARHEGITTVTLKPHQYLESFYQTLGYETVPGPTTHAGAHALITMTKTL